MYVLQLLLGQKFWQQILTAPVFSAVWSTCLHVERGVNCLPWMIFFISPSPLILFILPTKHLTILMNQFQDIVDDYIDVLLRDAAI